MLQLCICSCWCCELGWLLRVGEFGLWELGEKIQSTSLVFCLAGEKKELYSREETQNNGRHMCDSNMYLFLFLCSLDYFMFFSLTSLLCPHDFAINHCIRYFSILSVIVSQIDIARPFMWCTINIITEKGYSRVSMQLYMIKYIVLWLYSHHKWKPSIRVVIAK